MAASDRPPSQRQRRLVQLAHDWNLASLTTSGPSPPLTRPLQPPSFRSLADDAHAEQLLLRRSQQNGSAPPPQSLTSSISNPLLNRSFTTKKSRPQVSAKQVFGALLDHVRSGQASAGVAEALLLRLQGLGGNLDVLPQKKSVSNLLPKRRSLVDDSDKRGQILREAVRGGNVDLVSVLVAHADPHSLNESVGLAVKMRSEEITEVLLSYGARVCDSALALDEFRKACAEEGNAGLVGLILRSEGRPSGVAVSQAMVDATRAGCVDTVMHLSRSAADGNFNNAEALKIAVERGRRDLALAIAMGSVPPQRPGLDDAFTILFSQSNISRADKHALAEILLVAGAEGEAVDIGLIHAAASESLELVSLLVSFGTSITFRDALAVRNAVSKGQYDLVEILLGSPGPFGSEHASRCVDLIPLNASYECRHAILELLLRRGASGTALHNALVDASEAGDIESVRLLVTPEFPPRRRMTDENEGVSGARVNESHEVASVDHNGGLALSIAVTRGNVAITKLLLSAKPREETLAQVFPAACVLSTEESRYQIVEAFLLAGLTSRSLDVALQEAISKEPDQRDERLISMLLSHNANVNYAKGAGLSAAIEQGDIGLIRTLVGAASPETAGHVIPSAMKLEDVNVKREVVGLLLDAGAACNRSNISAALLSAVSSRPVDPRMLRQLLQQGEADMSPGEGVVLGVALGDPDPTVVKMLLKHGRPSAELVRKHLGTLTALPSTQSKATKMQAILPRTTPEDLNEMLVQEVSSATQTPEEEFSISALTLLLSAGADVNALKGRALCSAVAAGNGDIVAALLKMKPDPETIQLAFPHAIHNRNADDRYSFTEKLIKAEAPKREVTRALAYCVDTYTADLKLLMLLTENADTSDGIALVKAVRKESPPVVGMILEKGSATQEVLDKAFRQCTEIKDRGARLEIANRLLAKGIGPHAVSAALLAAVNDVDFALGKVLIEAGGSLEECDSQGIVRACRSGSLDMLSLLLTGMPEPKMEVLQEAFQAATDVGDLKARAVIFEMLLQKGVSGEVVDEQLASAARYGEGGNGMLRVLLAAGADPNHGGGESVCAAVRSAFLDNLKLLLGRETCHENQKRPSEETLSNALKASWKLSPDTRLTAVKWLFEAGLTATDHLHNTLIEVVNEEEEDLKLVELLLKHGASPAYEGCKAIIDVVSRASASLLRILLEYHIPDEVDHVLTSALKEYNAETWCTKDGLSALKLLMKKGRAKRLGGETISIVLGLRKPHDVLDSFVDVLLEYGVDVNYDQGKPLRLAAESGSLRLVQKLLAGSPSADPTPETLSLGLYSVFSSPVDEDAALALVTAFTEHDRDGTTLDNTHPHATPLLVRALDRYPRSREILQTLLNVGFYYDQMLNYRVLPHLEPEPVTLLLWALLQPQKKVSSALIELLISSGAKVDFETRISGTRPLTVAITEKRGDVVEMLLEHGADVHARDAEERTPLSTALRVNAGADVTRRLLERSAPKNDGSLHEAARSLNLATMQVLMEFGHEPDFPCPLHGGRTALAELCRYGATDVQDRKGEILLEKVMGLLIDSGSDLSIQSEGKSALLLALEGENPLVVTRALLRSGMWRHVNEESNLFRHGRFAYSPTMYLRVLPRTAHTDALYALLKANRCEDKFFACEGPQPEGAVGVPRELWAEELERRKKAERRADEEEAHAREMARVREVEELRAKMFIAQADLEASTRREQRREELAFLERKRKMEEEMDRERETRRRAAEKRELEHEEKITREVLSRARSVAEVEVEGEERRGEAMVRAHVRVGLQRAENERGVLALRGENPGSFRGSA